MAGYSGSVESYGSSVAMVGTGTRSRNVGGSIARDCGVREVVHSPGRDVVHRLSASGGGRRTRETYRLLCSHATACLRVCVCSYCVWIAAIWSVVVVVE
jgi:hypothetical protein